MNFFKDKVEETLYEKTVELMREDSFFYKNQPMQHLGLHKIDSELMEGNSSASMAFIYDEVLKHYGMTQNNLYYTYGWSGLLSSKSRMRDARLLFNQLEQEVQALKKQNYNPHIRLIGYSHGGNVILNLASVREKEHPKSNLHIHESILLGTPIIQENDYLINDHLFGKVYNIYSLRDRVQPLDLFAPNQLFSSRIFRPRTDFELPNKLVQIQLKVTRCKANVKNGAKRFELTHDYTNPSVIYGRSKLLRDASPGHAELWFFGWTPVNYRPSFPMYPLPAASLASVLTYHADKIRKDFDPASSIIADIRPEHNVILFRPRASNAVHSTVPYIPKDKVDAMHTLVMRCKPELYTHDIYQEHVNDAVKRASLFLDTKTNRSSKITTSEKKTAIPAQILTTGPIVPKS